MDWFKQIDEAKEWKREAEGSAFFGQKLSEMDKDELLAVVGYLSKDADRTRKQNASDLDMLTTIRAARRR
jgi:hypothetical protein